MRAVHLQNDLLAVTVLVDKGADIYELTYRPRAVDVLWKSPWGLPSAAVTLPTTQSVVSWMDAYPGGWQVLFPNGGDPCSVQGMELGFHGEAALAAWDYETLQADDLGCQVRFWTRLRRSPFRITRLMSLSAGVGVLTIEERITNEGGEPLPYMWSHHPAFGAPFLGPACQVDVGAQSLWADDELVGPGNPLQPGARYPWPMKVAGQDLSRVPDAGTPRVLFAYFEDFEAGWYAITNRELGFGVALVWPREVFPYAWFWQEMHASPGYPWYKSCYVMAIEPATSIPGRGLAKVVEKTGTQRQLGPGESASVTLSAVFFEGTRGVKRVSADGTVVFRGKS
jgi:hypothetical protein